MDQNRLFKLASYRYELPEELIAHEALSRRDDSRLLVVHRNAKRIEHRKIRDLPQILDSSYALVANNTQVFKARLLGERILEDAGRGAQGGGRVEFFLLKPQTSDGLIWRGLMKASANIVPGFKFKVGNLLGEVTERLDTPGGLVYSARFSADPSRAGVGEVPLPPYIVARRKALGAGSMASEQELSVYNTIYAREVGSVAAPTAGRHFTPELITALKERGMTWSEITLHVGMGTFKPVESEDIRAHQMHPEPVWIDPDVFQELRDAKRAGKKLLAIGTTTTRALEGADLTVGFSPGADVNLFIHPGSGHVWKMVDAMLTNFHLPESTLLMMVADFIGSLDWTLEIYQEAVKEKYRFYSYGDAMLIL